MQTQDCSFNFKASGQDAFAKANPKIKFDKLGRLTVNSTGLVSLHNHGHLLLRYGFFLLRPCGRKMVMKLFLVNGGL